MLVVPMTITKIKALTALVGLFSLSLSWESGPKWGLKTISFNP